MLSNCIYQTQAQANYVAGSPYPSRSPHVSPGFMLIFFSARHARLRRGIGHARWATTGALALVSCAPARLLLKRWWAGANHRSDQREFIRVLGREERVSVIAEESSPRGAYDNRTYVLHRCGGCRWMPPLERLLNASRAANGVDDAAAADALAAVWETRVLATFKQ